MTDQATDSLTAIYPEWSFGSRRMLRTRACPLCFERDHRICDRAILAELIHAKTGETVTRLLP